MVACSPDPPVRPVGDEWATAAGAPSEGRAPSGSGAGFNFPARRRGRALSLNTRRWDAHVLISCTARAVAIATHTQMTCGAPWYEAGGNMIWTAPSATPRPLVCSPMQSRYHPPARLPFTHLSPPSSITASDSLLQATAFNWNRYSIHA